MEVAIDVVQIAPGEVDDLQDVYATRLNNGWKISYLFNIDKLSFTCVYLIWVK